MRRQALKWGLWHSGDGWYILSQFCCSKYHNKSGTWICPPQSPNMFVCMCVLYVCMWVNILHMYFNVFVLSLYIHIIWTSYISPKVSPNVYVCMWMNVSYIYYYLRYIYTHILYDHITHTHGFGFHCHLVSLSLRDIYTSVAKTLTKRSDYPTHLSTSILESWVPSYPHLLRSPSPPPPPRSLEVDFLLCEQIWFSFSLPVFQQTQSSSGSESAEPDPSLRSDLYNTIVSVAHQNFVSTMAETKKSKWFSQ